MVCWYIVPCLVLWYYGLIYCMEKTRYEIYGICWWCMVYGENTVPGMWYVSVGGVVREKHSIWYGTLTVWYDGTVLWILHCMAEHRIYVVLYCWR